MFLIGCLLIVFFAKHFSDYLTKLHNIFTLSAIPQAPLDSYFRGHTTTIEDRKHKNESLDLLVEWTNAYGNMFVIWLMGTKGRPIIFCAEPEVLHVVASDVEKYKKFNGLPNRHLYGQRLVGTKSILSGNSLTWAVKRKVMTHFFAKTNIESLFEACKPHMEGPELNRWKVLIRNGKRIDLHDQLAITFSSYLQALGIDMVTPDKVAENVYKILYAIPKKLTETQSFYATNEKTEITKMVAGMRQTILKTIEAKLHKMKTNEEELEPTDMLGHLIEANKAKDGLQLEEGETAEEQLEFVVDDVLTVFLVMDNLVKQISMLFLVLSEYPKIQDTLFAELRTKEIKTFEDLNNLSYTEKCLLECLRMRPALTRGIRVLSEQGAQRLGPYALTNNRARILFSEYVMHHNPKYWKEPQTFNPDRWQEGFTPEPFSYMPFWVGARGCIGKHMAMMMMKLTLSVLAKNFNLQPNFDQKNPPMASQDFAVLRIKNYIEMYVTPYVQ